MAWFYLVSAGVLEVVWAYFMKKSAGFTLLAPSFIMIVGMVGSFWLLSLALKSLPLGAAYTIWTGIGAVGAFVVGIVFLGEAFTFMRAFAALLIVGGIVTMAISSGR
ncbi:MAG: multidrug efflux SMR transporter [Paracoccaceae bacterium]